MKGAFKIRFDRRVWLMVLALAMIYAVTNLVLPRLQINTNIKSYFLPSLLWLIIVFWIWLLPRYRTAGRIGSRGGLIQMGLILGVAQVVFYVLGGFFSGFGESPSSFAPEVIFFNFLLTGSTLIGMEFSRAWLLNHSGKRIFLSLAMVSVIYTILSLTLSQLTSMKGDMATVNFAGSTLLPALAENLLASLLALLGGPVASVAYRGILQVFWVFCPVLPDLSWSLKGMIGVLVPIAGLIITWNVYLATSLRGKARRQSSGGFPVGWIVTAVIAVLIIWFAVGIFPVHPVMIMTGSMTPSIYPGDLALVTKTDNKDFIIGDVIEYRRAKDINVVHRLVAINNTDGQKTYVTKGDANDDVDIEPVIPDNVVGKVVFVVPKLGWAADAVKSIFVK